jgi:hypothetical protein
VATTNFWVAAAAAAPVIAVANLVSLGDVGSLRLHPNWTKDPTVGRYNIALNRRLSRLYVVSYVNLLAQALALGTALVELAAVPGRRQVPLLLVAIIEALGIAVLADTSILRSTDPQPSDQTVAPSALQGLPRSSTRGRPCNRSHAEYVPKSWIFDGCSPAQSRFARLFTRRLLCQLS